MTLVSPEVAARTVPVDVLVPAQRTEPDLLQTGELEPHFYYRGAVAAYVCRLLCDDAACDTPPNEFSF